MPLEILTPQGMIRAEPGDLLCSSPKEIWVLESERFNIGMLVAVASTGDVMEWRVE